MQNCAKYIEDANQTFENKWKQEPAIALGPYASFIQRSVFSFLKGTIRVRAAEIVIYLSSNVLLTFLSFPVVQLWI